MFVYSDWKKSVEEEKKKKQEEEMRLKANKMSSYDTYKRNAMQEASTALRAENEAKKKAEEEAKQRLQNQVNNINQNFATNNPQTVEVLPTVKKESSVSNLSKNAKLAGDITPDYEYESKNKIFTKGLLDDGYDFGDVTKTILGTATDIQQDFVSGLAKPIENVADILANGGASYNNIKGNILNLLGNRSEGSRLINEANQLRNWANQNISEDFSKFATNTMPIGVLNDLVNGKPFTNQPFEYNTNKSLGENIDNHFKNTFMDNQYEKSSVLGGKADQVVNQIGYTAGQALYGKALGGASNIALKIGGKTLNIPTLAVAGGMSGGLQEANSKENVSELERWTKAITSGGIEGVSEGLFGFLGVGGNELTDIAGQKVASKFTSSAGKTLAKLGFQGFGEATEEFLSYAGNYLIDNGIVNKMGKADFSSNWNWNEIGEECALAFASTLISGGGTSLIQNNQAIQSAEQQLGRKLTDQEKSTVIQAVIDEEFNSLKYKNNQIQRETLPTANKIDYKAQATKEIQESKIDTEYKNAMIEALNNISEVTPETINTIRNQISQIIQETQETLTTKENNILPTSGKSFEDIADEAMWNTDYEKPTSPLESRNINTIGKETKVNAYQYDNPEVKPYFREMAQMLQNDIANISSPENKSTLKGGGTKLSTTIQAVKTLHNEMGYSYNDIQKGLNNIIEDHGQENNALSKKLEIIIDDQLRNGYRNSYGELVDPNSEYINLINKNTQVNTQIENVAPTVNDTLPVANEKYSVIEQNLVDSAKKYKLQYESKTIKEIQDALDKRGIKSFFDDTYFSNSNQGAMYILNKDTNERKIVFNPNANEKTIIQEMAIHELTHDIIASNTEASKVLRDQVLGWLEQGEDYQEEYNNLRNTYLNIKDANGKYVYNENQPGFEDMVKEEAIAKTLQYKLGTQEQIQRLVNDDRSKARKLYDWVVEKLQDFKNRNNAEYKFWKEVRNNFEKAFNEKEFNPKENKSKFDIRTDSKLGRYWNVEDSKDIFKGLTNTKDLQNEAYKYILNGNNNFEYITDKIDNKPVKFARISAQEYVYGRNAKVLNKEQYNQKMRTAPSIDDLINNADITYHSPLTHNSSLFKNGFNNYQGKVGIDNNIFQYIVRVGKAQNDNLFYDVSLEYLGNKNGTEIKVPSVKNTSLIKNSVPNNSISSSNKDVNTTKYSIQESKNNTDLPQNVKEISNLNQFIKEARKNETDPYWSSQLEEASRANYVDWTRKESRLHWKRSLIQQYLNYKNQNSSSSQDNQGRSLTKEQQDYFKNSKARNDKGQLETVYHGSNKAGFTEFNRNFNYFTNNKEMAQSYTRGSEMVDTRKLESISDAKSWLKGITDEAYINDLTVYDEYGDQLLTYNSQEELLKNLKRDIQKELGDVDAGGTYEGYVNIENPVIVEANGDKWSMIGIDGISIDGIDNIKQFLRDNGLSVWSEKGKLRTSTNDIVEAVLSAVEDGKIKADGIIIKDVYDEGGYGSTIPNKMGTDYITFNSNQFKAKDNMNPTSNQDIRYSINTSGEMQDSKGKKVILDGETGSTDKTLLAIHNLNEEKLKGVLELGGFPVPSIAITNPDINSHEGFGDISVIFNKNTIDPTKNEANKVYSRDAYTTRAPNVVNKLNESGIKEVAKNTGIEEWNLRENYKEMTIENAIEKIKRNEQILDKYLKEKGIEIEPVYRNFKGFTHLSQDTLQSFINSHKNLLDLSYTDKYTTDTYKKYYEDVHNLFVEDIMKEASISKEKAESFYKDYPGFNHWDYFIRDLDAVQKLEGKQQLDEYATRDAKEKAVNIDSREYKNFIRDLISPMYGEKYIRNNKDYYTTSGNPRSFDQRYEKYTLDNIVRIMNENKGTGQESTFGVGINEIAGDASKRFKNINEIKDSETLLNTLSEEEYKQIMDNLNTEYRYIENSIMDKYQDSSIDGYVWREKAIEDAMKNIARKMSSGKKITIQNAISQFEKNNIQINENQAQRTIDLIDELSKLPTNYFEAKPQRAVGFDEIDAIVIPSDTSEELKQQLKDRGIKIIEYDRNNENEKADILKSLDEYKFSKATSFDEYIKNRIGKVEGTKTTLADLKAPKANEVAVAPKAKRGLDPIEIANMKAEDSSTTPKVEPISYEKGNKQSNFIRNLVTDAQFLNKDLRNMMAQEDNIKYYKSITNADTLEKAFTSLQKGGASETMNWFNKNEKNISAEDIAKGWILLKQYQDAGDYQGAVEVAKKMRNMGTQAGQAVQAYNIMARLTPEGMFYYAQSELSEAFNKMAEGKTKEWIDKHQSEFELTPEETQFIKDRMETVQGTEDERTKKVALAEIQSMLQNKIPPTAGQGIKAWMRISMLFNPKTQIRNIMGNAVILPTNVAGDALSSLIDKQIAKKTGVRTTGNINLKNYAKGFGKGLFESYDDFRKGINTRNVEGDRFEIGEGKSFKDKGIGKALNRVDSLLSFMLDAGDRGFYEATFTNSLNNQMILNNTTEVTQDMVEIATNEALQRTWQDNNAYTESVLKIRNILNKLNVKGYGLGDVLIPFAKTPANLTKAIVDYSPVGLTKALAVDARKFKNSLSNGQYTPQLQHKFVQDLGKGMSGSLLYVLGYALAKAGIATGEADDDKDVKNFMKNSLGINSYSIKIGDKSFTYDWAQPVATPLAIMTNFVKYNKENPDASVIEKAINSMNIGTEQLLEQSFMESLNTVLNGNGTTLENLSKAVLDLPARAIPTFSKQIADLVDGTQRTSFEYGKPVESAINSIKAKIPGLSTTLPASIDTLGNEIKKYGGDNNLFNVMLNPANVNSKNISKAGEEIYDVYMETGDATILPRTAPYYINSKGEKITMTASQRNEFQKVSGQYVEKSLNSLLSNKDYKNLSGEEKAEVINEIVTDSYSKAKYDVLNIDSTSYSKLRTTLKDVSSSTYYDYKIKTDGMTKDADKEKVLVNSNYSDKEKQAIYETYIKNSNDQKYDLIKATGIDINEYLKYKSTTFESDKTDDGTVKGKTVSGSLKDKKYNYIINMDITGIQKMILFGLEYSPEKSNKQTIVNYITSLPGKTKQQKLDMLSQFSWITVYKDGTFNY